MAAPEQRRGFFHVREGRIASQHGYWDRLSFMSDAERPRGALP